MLVWFRDRAPIHQKLATASGLQVAILAGTCTALVTFPWASSATREAISCGALAASLALSSILNRTISRPYAASIDRLERLAQGDLDRPIDFAAKTDSVGRVARATLLLRQLAKDAVEAEHAAGEARRLRDADRGSRDTANAAVADKLAKVMQALASGLGKLADGDLVYRIEQPFTPDTEQLREDFNASLEQLQNTMSSVGGAVQTIRSGSREITTAADDLSRRTEQQAASLEETAAALNHITITVNKTAEAARHAREVVSTAKSDAEKSGTIVHRAVEAMGGIENSSRKISQIIGVIDEIAFQTNLLALNAGVEAARAGDAGRGFAVVASEVRGLAQRSAEAAKEIKGLISASEIHVGQGVDLVGQAGTALGRIVEHVALINTIVAEIASSAQEQATGLQEVNTAVAQMDSVTQQNAAMVEESTAASHALSRESGDLAQMIERFNTGRSVALEPVRRAPKTVAQKTMTQLKVVAPRGGAAAAKRKPAPVEDGWEEF